MPKLKIDYNATSLMQRHMHGVHDKDMIVLHETISHDVPGLNDIIGVEQYLASKDYGIHGVTDAEGNLAWALGLGKAVFWQCGGVNERSIGIEQVSYIPVDYKTNVSRRAAWVARDRQLHATAKLLSCIWRAHPLIARQYSDGVSPGVTSHWDVSQHFAASEGHTDCWPVHKGGYYPILSVVKVAQNYFKKGWKF